MDKLMRVLICGSRDFDQSRCMDTQGQTLGQYLNSQINIAFGNELLEEYSIEIVSGGARGADSYGRVFAMNNGYDYHEIKPDWDTYGKRAGFIRNTELVKYIQECERCCIVAIWDGESRGTADTIRRAKGFNIPVNIFNYKTLQWSCE